MSNSFYAAVGARISEVRKRSGMNQRELAEACGINRLYVGRVEKGTKNISLLTIGRLALALKVQPAEFFAGVEADEELLLPAPRINARPRAKTVIKDPDGVRKAGLRSVPKKL